MGEGQVATGEAVRLQHSREGPLPVPLPNETNRDQLYERQSHPELMSQRRTAPEVSYASALLEGKGNLMGMRQEIPLNESRLAALDDGLSALESLLSRLGNIPTPSGPTPLQLRGGALVQIEAAD